MEKWKSADSSESQWILSLFLSSLWKFGYSFTLNKMISFYLRLNDFTLLRLS